MLFIEMKWSRIYEKNIEVQVCVKVKVAQVSAGERRKHLRWEALIIFSLFFSFKRTKTVLHANRITIGIRKLSEKRPDPPQGYQGKVSIKNSFVTLLYSDSHRVLVADPSLFPTVFLSKIMAWFGLVSELKYISRNRLAIKKLWICV